MLKSVEQYREIYERRNLNEDLSLLDTILSKAVEEGKTSIVVSNVSDIVLKEITKRGFFTRELYYANGEYNTEISIYPFSDECNDEEPKTSKSRKEDVADAVKEVEEFTKYLAGRFKDATVSKVSDIKNGIKINNGEVIVDFSTLLGKSKDSSESNSEYAEGIRVSKMLHSLFKEGFDADFIYEYMTKNGVKISKEDVVSAVDNLKCVEDIFKQ